MKHQCVTILTVLSVFGGGFLLPAAENNKTLVQDSEKIAFLGDSITAQRRYSKYIDGYITMCSGLKDVRIFNFGLGGDVAPRAADRIQTYLFDYWKPDFMTFCFGMNDSGGKTEKFREGVTKIVTLAKQNKTTPLIVSPTVVDTFYWQKGDEGKIGKIHQTFEDFIAVEKEIAKSESVSFADIHHPMLKAMKDSKEKYGEKYAFAGEDGYHPSENGHFVMANEILKTMGFDGNIASLSMDFKGKASISEGHRIVQDKPGVLTVESTRYPFCFSTEDPETSSNPASILPFIDFQNALNRFQLIVKNLPSEKAVVDWGGHRKSFTKAELEKGINLADEFRTNPFSEPFAGVMDKLAKKGYFETITYCYIMPNLLRPKSEDFKDDAAIDPFISDVRTRMLQEHERLDSEVRKIFVPVTHIIKVIPE